MLLLTVRYAELSYDDNVPFLSPMWSATRSVSEKNMMDHRDSEDGAALRPRQEPLAWSTC